MVNAGNATMPLSHFFRSIAERDSGANGRIELFRFSGCFLGVVSTYALAPLRPVAYHLALFGIGVGGIKVWLKVLISAHAGENASMMGHGPFAPDAHS